MPLDCFFWISLQFFLFLARSISSRFSTDLHCVRVGFTLSSLFNVKHLAQCDPSTAIKVKADRKGSFWLEFRAPSIRIGWVYPVHPNSPNLVNTETHMCVRAYKSFKDFKNLSPTRRPWIGRTYWTKVGSGKDLPQAKQACYLTQNTGSGQLGRHCLCECYLKSTGLERILAFWVQTARFPSWPNHFLVIMNSHTSLQTG